MSVKEQQTGAWAPEWVQETEPDYTPRPRRSRKQPPPRRPGPPAVGVDPIQFGIIVVMNLVLGLCTPPVGVCLFAATNIGSRYGKCTLSDSVKALVPLLIVNFGVLFLVTYVPALTVGVANLLMG